MCISVYQTNITIKLDVHSHSKKKHDTKLCDVITNLLQKDDIGII